MIRTLRITALAALVFVAPPATAQTDEGAYLAARQAARDADFQTAASFYTQAMLSDPSNPALLEGALSAFVSLGQMNRAIPVAEAMIEQGFSGQLTHMLLMADAAQRDAWQEIFTLLEEGRTVSPLIDGLAQGWASVGEGDMAAAMSHFDEVIEAEGLSRFGLYHKALALTVAEDFETAETVFAAALGRGGTINGRAALAHAQVLSQLGRNDDAQQLVAAAFGNSVAPEVVDLRNRLATGETLSADLVTNATEGLGEVVFMVARLLVGETPEAYVLQFVRIAEALDPRNVDAAILAGELLDDLGRYDLANAAYARVPADNPAFLAAEIGRITTLQRADREEAAIEAAAALARLYPDVPFVHSKHGDTLRINEQLDAAHTAYTRAIDTSSPDDPGLWRNHYVRAITSFHLDDWPAAEAGFRAALDLQPENASVLNYLGYSLVERGEKLDEALDMIERAVARQPDNGAIVDSLGWALYKLGRFDEAVGYLERAASLEAVDPIINDHLGDALWVVGRRIEAEFQWNRALSLDPDDDLATRIRRKLEVGLGVVLEEEGTPLVDLANETR